jgi:glutaredoxin-like protein
MDKSMLRKDIRVFGTTWCGDCKRAEKWLKEQNIPFAFIDVDQDSQAQDYVRSVNNGNVVVPTILFPDGSILVEPSDQDLAEKLI